MTRRLVILRPEPGNSATAARVRAAGLEPLALPLFELAPLPWTSPDPGAFDGLLLTSANAIRHGGAQLDAFRSLPVFAVGSATADAARAAGFAIAAIGTTDVADLLERHAGTHRLLWLAGQDRTPVEHSAITDIRPVYVARPRNVEPADLHALYGSVALFHSARAARRFAQLLDLHCVSPCSIRVTAISNTVATAAGPGWNQIAVADTPTDAALIAAARTLAIDP